MMKMLFLTLSLLLPTQVLCQEDSLLIPEPTTLSLELLVAEAMMNNPEIQAALHNVEVMEARISQAGALDDPELQYMQEGMPDFKFSEAMFSRLELMQTIPFPNKLGTRKELASIRLEHADHDRLEKANDVIARLKSMYYELWFVQQNIVLDQENSRLMKQFLSIALTKYGTGTASQQEVLKAQIELAMITNDLTSLRQRELSAKAMMMALLNRSSKDSLGYAVIPEEVVFNTHLDTLIALASLNRPMLIHDSMMIREGETMRTMAKQEYLPDFKFGIERLTEPAGDFRGWSVRAGITLPFAPWTLGKAIARVDEAMARINQARSTYQSSHTMVVANVTDLFHKVEASKQQLETYRTGILPQARQSLNVGLTGYQNGRTDFFMLIDAYKTNVDLTKEYFMTRMQFEQTIAMLEREVGVQNISALR
jgi:cobalt-zinc-cadmium efflux system outer membrane protein